MYQGIVTNLDGIERIPGADRIVKGTCHGFTVVVGIDTKAGDLGIFFPCDGKFSLEMLKQNNLLKSQGGYFEEHGRIRAQKFKQVKSEGIWLPITCVSWTGVDTTALAPGDLIDTLKGHEVCTKYFTPATLRAMGKTTPKSVKRGETRWFPKHKDTPQLRFVLETIPSGSLIYFTEKLHGTSGRYGFVIEETERSWLARKFGFSPKREWKTLLGSKNVILTHKPGAGYYKDESFRHSVTNLSLMKGETLYYEIVGYQPTGAPIMPPQPVKDKELQKQYGNSMLYRYGQEVGSWAVYVYRITRTNEDGIVTELSWPQVKGRCKELGVNHVPEFPPEMHLSESVMILDENSNRVDLEMSSNYLLEGPSILDPTHIREGVCLRVEEPTGRIWFAKHKSFTFKVLEGIIKDNENYVDTEEVA
jgi:hypothetical protein